MGEIESQPALSCHQMKFPIASIGVLELVGYKGAHGNPQITQMFFHDCSLLSTR